MAMRFRIGCVACAALAVPAEGSSSLPSSRSVKQNLSNINHSTMYGTAYTMHCRRYSTYQTNKQWSIWVQEKDRNVTVLKCRTVLHSFSLTKITINYTAEKYIAKNIKHHTHWIVDSMLTFAKIVYMTVSAQRHSSQSNALVILWPMTRLVKLNINIHPSMFICTKKQI